MKTIPCTRVLVLAVILVGMPAALGAQSVDEFQKRRQAVRDLMAPDSILIVRNTPTPDDMGELRPDPNFYYLTGLTDPGSALVLASSRREPTTSQEMRLSPSMLVGRDGVLLFKRAPVVLSISNQPAAAAPPPLDQAGFSPGSVRRSSDFQALFDRLILAATGSIYLDYRRTASLNGPLSEDEQVLKAARDRGAKLDLRSVTALLAPLRVHKSPAEIALLRHAADITAAAEREAMRAARPGLFEYQLQSIIEHVFTMNGARRPGFSTIVGSGPNSCILHWSENTRETKSGDLVVMDIGAEYQAYTADITRTIPISGTFTKRQREVYDIVLRANEQAIDMLKPGVTMRDVSAKVQEVLGEGLIKLGAIKDKSGTMRYALHGPTHPIGLQVHDVGSTAVLEPGMVITIEPGLYFPEEGLGVRIEDDVLITSAGHEVITSAAPKSVQAIEALMKEGGGIDYRRYLLPRIGTN